MAIDISDSFYGFLIENRTLDIPDFLDETTFILSVLLIVTALDTSIETLSIRSCPSDH